jgi:putative chitinase
MIVTEDQLKQIMPNAGVKIQKFARDLDLAMREFQINTPQRAAMFLANVAHESGELRYVRELASGEDYEGRRDLGNICKGDGVMFKGRGLIQITGRANYKACGEAIDLDCINFPSLLEIPSGACRSAAWFWQSRKLNELADKGDFLGVCVKINGRNKVTKLPNGWEDRQKYYKKAKEVLGVE